MLDLVTTKRIQQSLQRLAVAQQAAMTQTEETIALLAELLELSQSPEDAKNSHRPMVDAATFSVRWRNETCFLGNTLPFRLFARLARSPNQYIAHLDLLDDVWGGDRRDSTIRGVIKRLRDRLDEAGMEELAKSIDGSVSGYYCLKLV